MLRPLINKLLSNERRQTYPINTSCALNVIKGYKIRQENCIREKPQLCLSLESCSVGLGKPQFWGLAGMWKGRRAQRRKPTSQSENPRPATTLRGLWAWEKGSGLTVENGVSGFLFAGDALRFWFPDRLNEESREDRRHDDATTLENIGKEKTPTRLPRNSAWP